MDGLFAPVKQNKGKTGKTFTHEELSAAVGEFVKSEAKVAENKESAVKLRAAERDLLERVKVLRDMLVCMSRNSSEKGRAALMEVFSEENTVAIEETVAKVELSAVNAKNAAWLDLQKELKQLKVMQAEYARTGGKRKQFKVLAPPTSLDYPAFVNMVGEEDSAPKGSFVKTSGAKHRVTPGKQYEFKPEIPDLAKLGFLTFKVEPALPDGLVLDQCSGIVSGTPIQGVEWSTVPWKISASNSLGQTSFDMTMAVRDPPPWSLSFEVPEDIWTSDTLSLQATWKGGLPTSFLVEPNLPRGLEIDPSSGEISGIPLDPNECVKLRVTAKNNCGYSTYEMVLKIKCAPPTALEYAEAKEVIPCGANVRMVPTVDMQNKDGSTGVAKWGRTHKATGASGVKWGKMREVAVGTSVNIHDMPALTFTVTPEMPEGLSLAPATGIIYGVRETDLSKTEYTVTCTNEGGQCQCKVFLEAKVMPPRSLKYPEAQRLLMTGEFVNFEPEVMGCVEQWYTEPKMPNGLEIDVKMGTISGFPVTPQTPTAYKVFATNSAGEAKIELWIEIRRAAPKDLQYKDVKEFYAKGQYLDLRPEIEGEVEEYTIKPNVPAGLYFDPDDAIISGVPAKGADSTVYEIVAKNESGSCSTSIVFGVKVMPPSELRYPAVDDEYGVGEVITLRPVLLGNADTWTVNPELPAGLQLHKESGLITGAAVSVTEENCYVVVAENEAGGASAILQFAVIARPPQDLIYPEIHSDDPAHVVTLALKTPLELVPQMAFNVKAKFTVDVGLPVGLILNEETGCIRGIPTVAFPPTSYTITATNEFGEATTIFKLNALPAIALKLNDSRKYADMLETITDLKDLPPDPTLDEPSRITDWMLWIAHRAELNDPKLDVVDFSNKTMPIPTDEPRVATKLAQAMRSNKYIKSLRMCNANLRPITGMELANACRSNNVVELLNLECNHLNPDTIAAICDGIMQNPDSQVHTFKIDSQFNMKTMGRVAEEQLTLLAKNHKKLTNLGYQFQNAHCLEQSNRGILNNRDLARRARKAATEATNTSIDDRDPDTPEVDQENVADAGQMKTKRSMSRMVVMTPAEKRKLTKLVLEEEPMYLVWEVFDDDNPAESLFREYCAAQKKIPSPEELAGYAEAMLKKVPHKEIALLIRRGRKQLLESFEGRTVTCWEDGQSFTGTFVKWADKNDRFVVDMWASVSQRLEFSTNQPNAPGMIEMSEVVVEWIAPVEKRISNDGWAYTWEEFESWYGENAEELWGQAKLWVPRLMDPEAGNEPEPEKVGERRARMNPNHMGAIEEDDEDDEDGENTEE